MLQSQTWKSTLNILHRLGLAGLVAALPLSNFVMSVSMFWLAGVWLLQIITDTQNGKKWHSRFQLFFQNRSAWMLSAFYLLPIIGLIWTDDFGYAAWDLRMKLPLLILPFLLTTLDPITDLEYRQTLGVFLLSLSFAVIWCLLIYFHINPKPYNNIREISVFISHVRFSLLLIFGLCVTGVESWDKPMGKPFTVLISALYLYFLYIIGSITGIMVLSIVLFWALIKTLLKSKRKSLRYTSIALLVLIPTITFLYLQHAYQQYFGVEKPDWKNLPTHTSRGDEYQHFPEYPAIENGHYIMTYVAWGELYQGWLERSDLYPDSTDARGHLLKGTLIRYLANKGLRKDLDGMRALTDDDIYLIEQGFTSPDEKNRGGLKSRMNRVFYEWSNYIAGGNPNGHSVIQRLEFWKTGSAIIADHPIFGVGTGDVKKSFASKYDEMQTKLDPEFRLRAHNQYMTLWISYGIFGLIAFCIMLISAWNKNKKNVLYTAFMIIAAMSFFTEDTLESQAGVMFFGFFFVFLVTKRKISLHTLRPVK